MGLVQRRNFLIAVGALLAAPLAAHAQQAAKIARIGYLSSNLASNPHLRDAFLQGLRDLGYVEGRNVVIEYRDAEGKLDRLPDLAAERPNWLRSRLMSSWPKEAHSAPVWPCKRLGLSPLSSLVLAIRLGASSSPALRGQAAMSRGCPASARS